MHLNMDLNLCTPQFNRQLVQFVERLSGENTGSTSKTRYLYFGLPSCMVVSTGA